IAGFRQAVTNRYETIANHRQPGQKVLGWMCSYFPEEIVSAAGGYPVRVLGGESTSYSDAYMHINMCSLVRAVFDEALQGKYDFLDGFATLNTCDNIRRTFDVWEYFINTPFTHILALPHRTSPASIAYFREELKEFTELLGKAWGTGITDDALHASIVQYNHMRRLLHELDARRKAGAISGGDFVDVMLAAAILPKEQFIAKVQELITQLKGISAPAGDRYRLIVTGSEMDDSDFIRVIEEKEAMVVGDDLCTGSKYYWNLTDETGDPLLALAERYLSRPPCPRMHETQDRITHLVDMVKSHEADGVVVEIMRFCKLYDEGNIALKKGLEEAGVPCLTLSREYSLTGVGSIRTRIEAFIEGLVGV
ncbi:MAG: 2-hydroxyacyl-CoA dehydratase family protein, partial [Dehalococcoidia bacterium]|nr:2-hydroxyacyl-CoA dehydratase family protein [Dehalococcoidia bacterium]